MAREILNGDRLRLEDGCQWVVAATCQVVEWPGQPLRFESVDLRTASRLRVGFVIMILLKGSVPTGNFAWPRLTSGAFAFLGERLGLGLVFF
jgi:hypothetical protein